MSQVNELQSQLKTINKFEQIDKLKKQVDLLTLSTRIQNLNSKSSCKQCIRKQQQIQTLIKAVKALKPQQQLNQTNELQKSLPLSIVSINQKYQISEQIKNINMMQNQYDDQNGLKKQQIFAQLSNLKQFIQMLKLKKTVYIDQILALKRRLNLFQETNQTLQQVNKNLQQQNELNKKKMSLFSKRQHSYEIKKPQKLYNQQKISHNHRNQPVFSILRNGIAKHSEKSQDWQLNDSQQCYATPSFQRLKHYYKNSEYFGLDTPSQVNRTAYRNKSLQCNLIQERQKSLDRKIKILQKENKKLRTNIFYN